MTFNFHDGLTIRDIVACISEQIPELKRIFYDSDLNDARSNSLVLVNGVEISVLDGYETKVADGDEIVFVPVVHGG
jgi:molybdopterin converting factor small subunit